MKFYCLKCKKEYPLNGLDYKCECGGLFRLKKGNEEKVDIEISLGEVRTPIIMKEIEGVKFHLKFDYLMPTGSFKDRGALVLINALKQLGITEIVEDSSGNAGASIAAYCAAAKIKCNIYIPENTSGGKIKQIKAYGARVIRIPGTRDDTANRVLEAARNIYYASHVYNPLFFEGTKTIAYEIYEQIGVPDFIFSPVGNGTMLLGIYLGFSEIGKLPRIIGIQSGNCCPVYNKFYGKEDTEVRSTLAEGIAVKKPARIDEIIDAVKESEGDMVKVTEDEINESYKLLGRMGIYVEQTAAAVIAGAVKYCKGNSTAENMVKVAPLTGTGLKK